MVTIGAQETPASSAWTQLWIPIGLDGQLVSVLSVPTQFTLSSWIGPVP